MTAAVRASHRDAHQTAAVIATAFRDLAVTAWLVPRPEDRQRVLYAHFRLLVDHALDHGRILITENRCAAAVWLPRDRMPAYLEASDANSRRLYLRHGYTDHGPRIEPPGGPPLWPMWRPPSVPDRR